MAAALRSTPLPGSGLRASVAVGLPALAFAAAAFYNGSADGIPLLFWTALASWLALVITVADRAVSRREIAITGALLYSKTGHA